MNRRTLDKIEGFYLAGILDEQNRFVRSYKAQIRRFHDDRIEEMRYQTRAVERAWSHPKPLFTGEYPTGSGKSVIAALLALKHVKDGGKVIYVLHNRTALGDQTRGIIGVFNRVFHQMGAVSRRIGDAHDVSDDLDVLFLSPWQIRTLKNESARFKALLDRTTLFNVDEAHHYSDDSGKVVFGCIHDVVDRYFTKGDRKTFGMTGTYTRLDGHQILGRREPDDRILLQEVVDAGYIPEIFGVQIVSDVVPLGATRSAGGFFDIKLTPAARKKWLKAVAKDIAQIYEREPWRHVPFAAFVRTVKDARALVRQVNEELRLKDFEDGGSGAAALTYETSPAERTEIIRRIQEGTCVGYVTIGVGEEAIDCRRIGVIHRVVGTWSHTRAAQSYGRSYRIARDGDDFEKKHVLIVCHQFMNGRDGKLIGLGICDYADTLGQEGEKQKNGGPLVQQRAGGRVKKNLDFRGSCISDEIQALATKRGVPEPVLPGTKFGKWTVIKSVA